MISAVKHIHFAQWIYINNYTVMHTTSLEAHRYEISTEDDSEVGDVDSADCWLVKDVKTDNSVLL